MLHLTASEHAHSCTAHDFVCCYHCNPLHAVSSAVRQSNQSVYGVAQVTEEARDNLKFLTTLERHFKNITSGPLPGIVDTLPPTMNALRMVWIISRYYSDDMRMGALFKRIGQEIGDRVEAAIDVRVMNCMYGDIALYLLHASVQRPAPCTCK